MSGPGRTTLDAIDCALLDECRVGRLATASVEAEPHVIPVCYAVLDPRTIVFAIDDKPKASGRILRRLRNLMETEQFALVVDRWDEDWGRLAYVLMEGLRVPIEGPDRSLAAVQALRARYPQYVEMGLDASVHQVVELRIRSVRRWGRIRAPQ